MESARGPSRHTMPCYAITMSARYVGAAMRCSASLHISERAPQGTPRPVQDAFHPASSLESVYAPAGNLVSMRSE